MKHTRIGHGTEAVGFIVALGAALLVGLSSPPSAAACGGFFCSQVPVNQAAEEILFADNGDGTITTVIEIEYTGPSESFAWLLPIPGDPEIDVSSGLALSRLAQATNPQYNLDVEVEGVCKDDTQLNPTRPVFRGDFNALGATAVSDDAEVTVVSMGEVGPYEFHVIALNESLPAPGDSAVNWLHENGYDVPSESGALLGPYLSDGLNLLAVKLTKTSDAGSIRPLMLTYESDKPMIPLRPTAVAAELDMGLQVYVAGRTQAVPFNYKSLVLNEALIDWLAWQQVGVYGGGPGFGFAGIAFAPTGGVQDNYYEVVSAAADEAGGQGFVTELGADGSAYEETIFSAMDQATWDDYSQQVFADGFTAIESAQVYYRLWDGWRDAIRGAVTLPAGVSFDEFGRNPNAYRDVAQIDGTRFKQLLWENVVRPVRDTQTLLRGKSYLTRMFSTMSPEEMTVDPVFGYNSDLMDVSNVHTARQTIHCSPDVLAWDAPWTIDLPHGGTITGTGSTDPWPYTLEDGYPANLRVVDVGESGGGMVVMDNADELAGLLEAATGLAQSIPSVPVMMPGTIDPADPEDDGRVPLGSGGTMTGVMRPEVPGTAPSGTGPGAAGEGPAAGPSATPTGQGEAASTGKGDGGGLFCAVQRPGAGGRAGLLVFPLALVLARLVRRRRR